MELKRGDIVLVDLEPVEGSEQGKTRPCLVIQNNVGNRHSPTTIVAPLTTSYDKVYPFNVEIPAEGTELEDDCVILLNQIVTVDIDERIVKKITALPREKMEEVNDAIAVSLGLR